MDAALATQAESIFGGFAPADDLPPVNDDAPLGATDAASTETEAPLSVSLNLTVRQHRRLWKEVESIENFWETLEECEAGTVARLGTLAGERRWEVIFLTRRPETAGATAQVQTQRWLEAKGFSLPSVYVVQGSRGRIASALGLHIIVDDRPENCLDVVAESRARAILVWRDSAKPAPVGAQRLGIEVVASVGECLDVLTELGATQVPKAGLAARLMRALGLTEGSES